MKLFNKEFITTRKILPNNIELDCFCEFPNVGLLAIEYNGKQHVQYDPYLHNNNVKNFEGQKERDERRRMSCEELGIDLIEISHKLRTYRNIRNYIIKRLQNTKYSSLMNTNITWSRFYISEFLSLQEYELNELKKIAIRKGGTLISTEYIDTKTHLLFKCKVDNHKPFSITPNDVKQNNFPLQNHSVLASCQKASPLFLLFVQKPDLLL